MAFDLARAMSELYGSPLEAFVDKRKELANQATSAGDKQAAAALKKVKKPTRIAWALNRLAHRHGKALDAFFESADALRTAQAQSLRGQPTDLRRATTDQRRELERLVALALRELSSSGMGTGAGAERALQSTLHAAAFGSLEARQAVQTGRLERELEPESGLEALAGVELPPREKQAEKPRPQPEHKASRDKAERERERERQQAERERAKLEREKRTQTAKELERQATAKLAEARELEQSAKELEQRAALERSRAERARKEADKLHERIKELRSD
ncbi:MAG TPA: hypothetical protein VK524_24605 [Polyangiaceae bacterium]|nr:hypothetical protein [Polyangiaceae bacterium]